MLEGQHGTAQRKVHCAVGTLSPPSPLMPTRAFRVLMEGRREEEGRGEREAYRQEVSDMVIRSIWGPGSASKKLAWGKERESVASKVPRK